MMKIFSVCDRKQLVMMGGASCCSPRSDGKPMSPYLLKLRVQCLQAVPVQDAPGVLFGICLTFRAKVSDNDVFGVVGSDLLVAAVPAHRGPASGTGYFGMDAACANIKFESRLHRMLLSYLDGSLDCHAIHCHFHARGPVRVTRYL
jgi:hypothetical protein